MIRKADNRDIALITELSYKLFREWATKEELLEETKTFLRDEDSVFFIATFEGEDLGYAQCGLRRDYVEGTETSPVGYLEAIYVEPHVQRKGLGGQLVRACEAWGKEKGCVEFGSDTYPSYTHSIAFHEALGFKKQLIMTFHKKI